MQEALQINTKCSVKCTLRFDASVIGAWVARFPRSICTETLACDKSTPELCSACVRVFSNLFHSSMKNPVSRYNSHKKPKSKWTITHPWEYAVEMFILPPSTVSSCSFNFLLLDIGMSPVHDLVWHSRVWGWEVVFSASDASLGRSEGAAPPFLTGL